MNLIAAICLLSFGACSKSETPPPAKTQTETHASTTKDPEAARKLIAAGAVVVDVRTTDEFTEEHLPTAANIPVQELGTRMTDVDKLVGPDKTRPIVVYCASGGRAGKAKAQLEAAGYTNVVNGGGLDDLR